MLLEKSEGGICLGEEREAPSRTGHDPWVLTAVGIDGKFFSILPEIRKVHVINYVNKGNHTLEK